MKTSKIICLFKKIFGIKRKAKTNYDLPMIYDVILFNYEGEKRVDIITSIEEFHSMDTSILVFGTCAHGLIKSTSVEKNLGSIE